MQKEIKKVKFFPNNNEKSEELYKLLEAKMIKSGFLVVEEDYDLAIAIGGDGAFLRMVKANNFDSEVYYVGINAGTLGFLQEVKDTETDLFIDELKRGDYKIQQQGIQETEVIHENNDKSLFYSLNEIVVRDKHLKTLKLEVRVDDDLLENFAGDGILVATSVGSTAQNFSLGGSIIDNSFSTLQITPIAPLNTSSYRSLSSSVILPSYREIKLMPEEKKDLIVTVDGENNYYNDVSQIRTKIRDKEINFLRLSRYNFPEKINEKLL